MRVSAWPPVNHAHSAFARGDGGSTGPCTRGGGTAATDPTSGAAGTDDATGAGITGEIRSNAGITGEMGSGAGIAGEMDSDAALARSRLATRRSSSATRRSSAALTSCSWVATGGRDARIASMAPCAAAVGVRRRRLDENFTPAKKPASPPSAAPQSCHSA